MAKYAKKVASALKKIAGEIGKEYRKARKAGNVNKMKKLNAEAYHARDKTEDWAVAFEDLSGQINHEIARVYERQEKKR